MEATAVFAATFAALYAGHHIGDYWVQTDHQARHKGDPGRAGALQCLAHVLSYLAAQSVCMLLVVLATDMRGADGWPAAGALTVSGLTHYAADRREHGLMSRLARLLPGKADFMRLGAPRAGRTVTAHGAGWKDEEVPLDNPSLGTGTWALDQAWHIALGVFLPALIMAAAAR